ncbi:hypothetical protein [Mumia sp. DW29H23]|uniref:hypothetical protein n=1 Tax=Mumia sp. DW29H23 TaxID=3421241 RepID=UPI003D698160
MGLFRSKGAQDEVKSSTSGQPLDPEHRAVTQVFTDVGAGITWAIGTPAGVDGTTTGKANVPAPEPDETAAADLAPVDEVADSVQRWFQGRTRDGAADTQD